MLLCIFLFILGLILGSFGNVVVWRIPARPVLNVDGTPLLDDQGEEVVKRGSLMEPRRSCCPKCEKPIRWQDNIPVVSWIVLHGKCRNCHASISIRYPLVELSCGLLFVLVGWKFGAAWSLPAYLLLALGLVVLTAVDLDLYLLPNRIVYPLGMGCAALLVLASAGEHDWMAFRRALLCAVVTFAAFFLLHLIYPRGMGFGDVRLSFVLGLMLGWLGVGFVLVGIFLAYLYGAVIGLIVVLIKRGDRRTLIPFGPFLAAGTLTAVLVGQHIIDWYTRNRA